MTDIVVYGIVLAMMLATVAIRALSIFGHHEAVICVGSVIGTIAMLVAIWVMRIEHNPHQRDCLPLDAWIKETLAAGEDIDPLDRAAILATRDVWIIDWCSDTPIGSCTVIAATLDRALALRYECVA